MSDTPQQELQKLTCLMRMLAEDLEVAPDFIGLMAYWETWPQHSPEDPARGQLAKRLGDGRLLAELDELLDETEQAKRLATGMKDASTRGALAPLCGVLAALTTVKFWVTESGQWPNEKLIGPIRDKLTRAKETYGPQLLMLADMLDSAGPVVQASQTGDDRSETEPHADGPEAGCWLWWRGKRHDIPQGVTYRLVAYMWSRDSTTYAMVEDEVFGDATCPSTLRARVSEVNKVLKKLDIPWRLTTNSTDRILVKQAAK